MKIMILSLIGILFLFITVTILKDTYVKVYNWRGNLIKEYTFKVKIWMLLTLIIIYSIPVINIFAFLAFIIYYLVHVFWDPTGSEKTHVFYSKKISFITKLLNKEI